MRTLALALLGGLLLGGCEYRAASEAGDALQEEEQRATRPDQGSEDVRFYIYEDDRPRALVEAKRMERYEREDSTYTLLHGAPGTGGAPGADSLSSDSLAPDRAGRVTARIYSEGERGSESAVSATIRSNRLVYYDEARRFDARGRVVVTTAAGKRVEPGNGHTVGVTVTGDDSVHR
jgi:hypothetical protein